MLSRKIMASVAGVALVLSFGVANAASALTVGCVGVPTTSNITWTASTSGGVAPVALVWGNGSTSSTQTITSTPGTYAMTLTATDASTTVATTSCSASVALALPVVTSFTATPASLTSGQSAVLSWVVSGASSTSLDNGIGAVSSTSVTVTPVTTTTYNLSATNPGGTTSASVTVTVNTQSSGGTSLNAQIQALLAQMAALKLQLASLIAQAQQSSGSTTPIQVGSTTPGLNCFNFRRDLHRGDDGDDVKGLQETLASDPSIFPQGLVTGFFGARTEDAIRKYQEKYGILANGTSTGYFGPMTRTHLMGHCGKPHEQQEAREGEDNNSDNSNWNNASSSSSTPSIRRSNERGGKKSENNGRGEGRGMNRDD